jgi:hypothetical protein
MEIKKGRKYKFNHVSGLDPRVHGHNWYLDSEDQVGEGYYIKVYNSQTGEPILSPNEIDNIWQAALEQLERFTEPYDTFEISRTIMKLEL